MKTSQAFVMGMLGRGNTMKVFDWNKAAEIIGREKPTNAVAGLSTDMEWTSGLIYENGEPVAQSDTYTYLASTWATPVLVLDYGREIPCFVMDTPDENPDHWHSGAYWPPSALEILEKASNDGQR